MAKPKASGLQNAFGPDNSRHLEATERPAQRAGNGKRLVTEGTSLLSAHLPVKYSRTLAMMAAEEGVTRKDLMQEALEMLFRARGRAPVAPDSPKL